MAQRGAWPALDGPGRLGAGSCACSYIILPLLYELMAYPYFIHPPQAWGGGGVHTHTCKGSEAKGLRQVVSFFCSPPNF